MEDSSLFYLLADQRQATLVARERKQAFAAATAALQDTEGDDQAPDEGETAPSCRRRQAQRTGHAAPAQHPRRKSLCPAATSVLYALASDAEDTAQYSAVVCSEALLAVLLPQASTAASGSDCAAAAARTAAVHAATGAHSVMQLAARLLELGADPSHVRQDDGLSPLLAAVRGGHAEVAAVLLEAGALPEGPTSQAAEPATQAAASAGAAEANTSTEPAAALRSAKRKRQGEGGQQNGGQAAAKPLQPTPLVQALAARNAALVDCLLAAGADANRACSVQSGTGSTVQLTPLIAAVNAGDAALVARLLEAGADLHTKCATANGSDWTRWAVGAHRPSGGS